ncbi:MAG: hypothetical protein K0R69_2738 [Clostridia bacterium]|jgi:seryl-tRNA synthetase|nr:hypothetical protein [Clostridia bacterium]
MKKLIMMLLSTSLLVTGSMAYANDTTAAKGKGKLQTRIENRIDKAGDRASEIKSLKDEISLNRTEIMTLRAEAKTISKEIKEVIKEAKAQKDTLTDEQISRLAESVTALKNEAQKLELHTGEIKDEVALLREARKNKDTDSAKISLQKIIDVQTARIDNISVIIANMKKLLADFNEII